MADFNALAVVGLDGVPESLGEAVMCRGGFCSSEITIGSAALPALGKTSIAARRDVYSPDHHRAATPMVATIRLCLRGASCTSRSPSSGGKNLPS
jgi:hypothetical protein